MKRLLWASLAVMGLVVASAPPAPACSLCNPDLRQAQTFRQEAEQARLVLYGTLENARLEGAVGSTDLRIGKVLKEDKALGEQKVITLPRYVPVQNPKDPPRFVVFCDVFNNKLDPYRGVPLKTEAGVEYLKGALALDPKDRTATLLYYFRYLEHPDPEVAADAFLEFAKANDAEIGKVAPKLNPDKLREWIRNKDTPAFRVGVYAFLLGGCGGEADAAVLREMIEKPTEQSTAAVDGFLGGYLQLKPKEGWELALGLLADQKKPFTTRYAVLRTLRFYHGWKPDESKAQVLRGLATLLPEGDIADLAIEDLRRWQLWELTPDVLAQYGKTSHNAPIMKRSIVRYALSSAPARQEAADFLAERRRTEPDLVKEVEESLKFEKK